MKDAWYMYYNNFEVEVRCVWSNDTESYAGNTQTNRDILVLWVGHWV